MSFRNKIYLAIGTGVFVIVIAILIWAIKTGRIKGIAETLLPSGTQQTGANLDKVEKVTVYAGGLNFGGGAISFQSPIGTILPQIQYETEKNGKNCVRKVFNDNNSDREKLEGNEFNVSTYGGTCNVKFNKFPLKTEEDIIAEITISMQGDFVSEFPQTYQTSTINNQGKEKVEKGPFEAEMKGKVNIFKSTVTNSWNFTWHDTGLFKGKIDTTFSLEVKGNENLLDKVKNFLDLSDFSLDPKSSWKVNTIGAVNGALAADWDVKGELGKGFPLTELLESDQVHITKYDFCPSGCKFVIGEDLFLLAHKLGTKDNVSGEIESDVIHTETYAGTGAGDPQTGQLYWKTLTVDKKDQRHWKQNLKYPSSASSSYEGTLDSTAHVLPLEDYSKIDSKVVKSLNISIPPISPTPIPNDPYPPSTATYQINVNKTETNTNGTIERSGTGSRTACASGKCNGYSGYFDNNDQFIYSSPDSFKGKKRNDPFSDQDVQKYTTTYFPPGTIYVPGLFTASYGDAKATAISSPPIKLLPQKVYFFIAETNPLDTFPNEYKNINKFLDEMENAGVKVIRLSAKNREEMLAAFGQVESGSWVINFGHGLPTGLHAGDTDFVEYADIEELLENKQIKINVFTGISCYLGRAPLAQTIIGSMGVSLSGPSPEIGNKLGIGSNGWNYTIDDIITILTGLTGTNPTQPALTQPTPTPTIPSQPITIQPSLPEFLPPQPISPQPPPPTSFIGRIGSYAIDTFSTLKNVILNIPRMLGM